MKRMTTLKNHERRITSLEETVTAHRESLYDIKRTLKRHDLRWEKLFDHFNIEDVVEEQVDEALDAE